MTNRNPIHEPKPGDILQRPDGQYVLVDSHNECGTGFMCTDRITGTYIKLAWWSTWASNFTVIERGPEVWPYRDRPPSREESFEYLKRQVAKLTPRVVPP